ncbi:hypothetical protein LGQ02_04930 [Bacillus shivajii]|uniref:hypothetical protein n=1 Tax=Bacillus shivajii TaxID=1983719 RepID=UPI001CFBB2B1|nr:hypothetical protein [Bacillus shivajii]UCZ54127.1 hypothetical protein LGQ02_04930 [Bacillus shivajii]
MKQLMPFVLIALIVGGAMLFLNDSYEAELDPDWSQTEAMDHWEMTFFLDNVHEEKPEVGVKLESIREEIDIEAIEFFVDTQYGGFFFQDLDVEGGTRSFTYTEECDFCLEAERNMLPGNVIVNWREKDEDRIFSEFFHFDIQLNH